MSHAGINSSKYPALRLAHGLTICLTSPSRLGDIVVWLAVAATKPWLFWLFVAGTIIAIKRTLS
jgi:hypothetical protein